ncbi:MAG: ABC transporter substrate-binding protein [Paracoccaceae bacterium]
MKVTAKLAASALALGALGAAPQASAQDDVFRVGIVTFLSGQAAESFGVPAWNGGKTLIDMLNEGGRLPEPYTERGFGGLTVEAVLVDEAGGATKQVQEFRNLVQREEVDAVIAYVSSADCLAVPPVADELKAFTILYDCGTPRVFEEGTYEYVFRTAAHGAMDNVSLARYLQSRGIEVETIAGINQDYAWGHDSWDDFEGSMKQLYPDVTVETSLFPKFGAGQYGAEVSSLIRARADVTHSSLWGGDLQGLVLQASARGLHERSQLAFSAGDHVIPQLQDKMPEGIILGARGVNGLAAKARGGELEELTMTLWDAYEEEWGVFPVQAPFRMWQAVLGLKAAVEKAMAENGGVKPDDAELAAAMKGLSWPAPSGVIEMALADGHQAIQPNAIGVTKWDSEAGEMILVDVEYYDSRCVNPPEGIKAAEWIAQGFPGAECD